MTLENTDDSKKKGIQFNIDGFKTPILEIKENGNFYVKGKLIETDKEVYDALKSFLQKLLCENNNHYKKLYGIAFEAGVMQALYKPETVANKDLLEKSKLEYEDRFENIDLSIKPERSDDEKFYDNVFNL